jgi:hypothetical protein
LDPSWTPFGHTFPAGRVQRLAHLVQIGVDIREDGEERLDVAVGQMGCLVIAAIHQVSRATGEQLDVGATIQRWLLNALDAETQLALELDKGDEDPM